MTPRDALDEFGQLYRPATGPARKVHIDACAGLRAAADITTVTTAAELPLSASLCRYCDPEADCEPGWTTTEMGADD